MTNITSNRMVSSSNKISSHKKKKHQNHTKFVTMWNNFMLFLPTSYIFVN